MKNMFKLIYIVVFLPAFAFSEEPQRALIEKSPDHTERLKRIKIKGVSDLKNLTPFESVSIIQKRYLQKTFRGELSVSTSSIINNKFFYLFGGGGHLGFFLREDHGFGIEGYRMYHREKLVSLDLIQAPNHILPYALVISQLYGGGYYKWSPVFGKFSVLNKKIVYFDMFFTFGGGMTGIISGLNPKLKANLKQDMSIPTPLKRWVPTGSIGLGQIFAINKNFGFSWNLKWFFYAYELQDQSFTLFHSDLNLTMGMNYYFPGATYR